jgi:hypothetical protein
MDSCALKWPAIDTTTSKTSSNVQLDRLWKEGSDLHPHFHYFQHTAADTMEFIALRYRWTDLGETRPNAWTYVRSTNQTYFTYTSGTLHQLAIFPAITGSGHTLNSALDIQITIWSDAAVFTKFFDIHYELDKPGSYNQYSN